MSRPASCSFKSSQRECKYKSVAYWEMRVVTTKVSGQSVSNSLGSSDQFLTCSRYIEWSFNKEWWCILQKRCSNPVSLRNLGTIIQIHEAYKLHIESLLSSSSKEIRTDLLPPIYLFSSIGKKEIRRRWNQYEIENELSIHRNRDVKTNISIAEASPHYSCNAS